MADKLKNLTTNIPDNALKNGNCTPDNTPENELAAADNTQQNTGKTETFDKSSILELQKKYGIGRDPLYARMRYLAITTWKVSGKAYLDARQVAEMDGLHDHIKATGRMEGYPIPEPSGLKPEEVQKTTAITVTQVSALTEQTTVEEEELNISECRQEGNSELEAIASLVRSAQNKAAGVLIAENVLAEQFINNPDSLPEELKTMIKQSSKVPDIDPFAYAKSLVNLATNPGAEAAF